MKIADAYFDGGFGQRMVRPQGVVMPNTSGAEAIAQEGERLGKTIAGIGFQQLEEEGQTARALALERKEEAKHELRLHEAELKETLKLKDTNTAKRKYLSFETDLALYEQGIIKDPEISPEEYPGAVAKKAKELADGMKQNLNERQWLAVEVDVDRYGMAAVGRSRLAAEKEIKDQAWAEDLGAADAVVNNPVKSAQQKIILLKDGNFMTDTGRPLHEIEAERQKRITTVIDNEVKHTFNATRDDPEALRALKATIQAKDAAGNFTYFPDMQQAKREEYVYSVQMKMEQAENRRREEASRRKTEERQGASELVTEFKDKVAKGWVPNTADDYQFVNAVKRASALSPSLSRQFNEANTNMGSLEYRSQLKKKDPLGVAAAERGVQLTPFNFLDTATIPQQFARRVAQSKALGVNAVFMGGEADAYTDYIKTLDPRSQVNIISNLKKMLGPVVGAQTFDMAAEQTKIKDPSMSMLFKLVANGKHNEAQLYASGKALITGEKKDFLQEKVGKLKDTMSTMFDAALGTALLRTKNSRDAMKDAVAVTYIGAAYQRNLPLDVLDKDLFRDVVKRVVGETTITGNKYMGSGGSMKTTIIPAGMDEDTFLNAIKAIKPTDIARQGGVNGMTDEEAAEYVKKVGWHELGNGYTFQKDGVALYNKKGRPFIFRFD